MGKRCVSVRLLKNCWVWGDTAVYFLEIKGPEIGVYFKSHFNLYAFPFLFYTWSTERIEPLLCRQHPSRHGGGRVYVPPLMVVLLCNTVPCRPCGSGSGEGCRAIYTLGALEGAGASSQCHAKLLKSFNQRMTQLS